MSRVRVFLSFSIVVLTGLMSSSYLNAAASFDSISFKPATDQGYYLVTQQSQTLQQWRFAAGFLTEFSNDSVIATSPSGTRLRDVVENEVVLNLGGAIGLLDWLNMGVLIQFVPYQQFNAIATGISDNGARMGDIRLDFKARILDNENYPVGIAIVPFVTFPSGNDSHLVGNGKVTGGGLLVIDSPRIAERVSLALNVGGQVRERAMVSSGTAVDDQFLVNFGVNGEVAEDVQIIAELDGWTFFDDFWSNNLRNLEGNGAVRWFPKPGLALTAGGGAGILDAIGAPDFRVFVGISYRQPEPEAAPAPQPKPKKVEIIRTNMIHFAFDEARILPESFSVLDNIVKTIKGRPEVEHVTIVGHTDSKGSDEYNLRLSDRRANSVKQYMVEHGIAATELTAVGKGESEPIASNDTREGRAENRRVEFHLEIDPTADVTVIEEEEDSPTYLEGGTQ